MAQKDALQEKFRQLGVLVDQLDAVPGGCSSESCRELIQLLMEVHGAALEQMMEIVDQCGAAGEAILLKAGEDPIMRPLLVLYSLHPESLESRVLKALDAARQRLRKLNSEVELVESSEGSVKVLIRTAGHACGSTAKTVYVVDVDTGDEADDSVQESFVQPHAMNSMNVLRMARAMQGPLKRVLLVGCEPASFGGEEGAMGLSAAVEAAVEKAVGVVTNLVERILDETQFSMSN